jgi:hypothetical protein
MGSSGKRKTTMAKLARENRLRERRLNKEAKRDARKLASSEQLDHAESHPESDGAQSTQPGPSERNDDLASAQPPADDTRRELGQLDDGPSDPRDKEVALLRLRDASDEELAVFEPELRSDALQAGASELEMRDAQRNHPGHDE